MQRIVAAGRKHKKALGFMAADADWARHYKKLGFNMIATGTDHGILMPAVRNILSPRCKGRDDFQSSASCAIC